MTVIIGIDPGKSGAIAVKSNDKYNVYDIPTMTVISGKGKNLKKSVDYDIPALHKLLVSLVCVVRRIEPTYAVVERAEAVTYGATSARGSYHNSAQTNFSKGRGYGIIEAVLQINSVPIIASPRPGDWKRGLGLTDSSKAYTDKKEASRLMALDLYPELADKLRRKKDNGRAEALLLIEWLELQIQKGKITLI